MNDKKNPAVPVNTWEQAEPIERIEARLRVVSSISSLPQSLGPENVKEAYHLSDEKISEMEKPQVIDYSADGEILIYPDHVTISYPEPEFTGMGDCRTTMSYWLGGESLLELNRTGLSAVHCFFDPKNPRQSVVFQTPFGSLESIITLKQLVNLMDHGIGRIFLSYTMDFPNIYTEQIDLRIDARRLSEGEKTSKIAAPQPDAQSLRQMEQDLASAVSFSKAAQDEGENA